MKLLDNPLTVILHVAKSIEKELNVGCIDTCGMTHTDARILMMIAYHPRCSSRDLASLLQVSPAAVSRQIKKLENQGLVRRMLNPSNRRVGQLELTRKGVTIQSKVQKQVEQVLDGLLGTLPGLSPRTITELIAIAGQLGDWNELHNK